MDRNEYVCNQMYKQHALLRKDSWTDADKLEYMELNIAPYSRYWRMGMKKALKHAIKLLREEEAEADRKDESTTQMKTQNSNLTFEKDECAKEYEELGLKELKELIEADRKDGPQTDCAWK